MATFEIVISGGEGYVEVECDNRVQVCSSLAEVVAHVEKTLANKVAAQVSRAAQWSEFATRTAE